ncbi:STAS domain-containing protein [Streptomyces vinaceus]|uniref:STAS domain-containing protein n=1 Tax=Streptomyces vinaceus TaxID=1960 RepID=UPI0037F26C4B
MNSTVQRLPDENGTRIILCAGEFDFFTTPPLAEEFTEARARLIHRVILDVSQITFADSVFLNTLVLGHRTLALVLAGPVPTHLAQLLALTRLDTLLTIAPDLLAAAQLP